MPGTVATGTAVGGPASGVGAASGIRVALPAFSICAILVIPGAPVILLVLLVLVTFLLDRVSFRAFVLRLWRLRPFAPIA